MHKNEAPVLNGIRVVSENQAATHPNVPSVQKAISCAHGNFAQPQIEEAQLHECDSGLHRNQSSLQAEIAHAYGNNTFLQSGEARTQHGFTRT